MNFSEDSGPSRVEPELGANVILIGAMGSGKSTSGWLLARLIGYGFVDLDQSIEVQEGLPVHEIFDKKGEGYFRDLERNLIEKLSPIRSHVVAAGGGAVMNDESWELLQRMGITVW